MHVYRILRTILYFFPQPRPMRLIIRCAKCMVKICWNAVVNQKRIEVDLRTWKYDFMAEWNLHESELKQLTNNSHSHNSHLHKQLTFGAGLDINCFFHLPSRASGQQNYLPEEILNLPEPDINQSRIIAQAENTQAITHTKSWLTFLGQRSHFNETTETNLSNDACFAMTEIDNVLPLRNSLLPIAQCHLFPDWSV